MSDFDYLKEVDKDAANESVVEANVIALLENELGMKRVSNRRELVNGTFAISKSIATVSVTCTLEDRPFVGGFLYKTWRNDASAKYRGSVRMDVTQIAAAPQWNRRVESRKFGDRVWRVNHSRHGIEVSFDKNPGEKMTACLKKDGAFRWSSRQGVWYGKDTEENRKLMQDMSLTHVGDVA